MKNMLMVTIIILGLFFCAGTVTQLSQTGTYNASDFNSIHGELIAADGSVAMTGALDMGSQNITNAGTIASGNLTVTGTGSTSSTFTSGGNIRSVRTDSTDAQFIVETDTGGAILNLNSAGANEDSIIRFDDDGTDKYLIQYDSSAALLRIRDDDDAVNVLSFADTTGDATFAGAIVPASLADASAPNSSLYYSTDASKLVYKDSGGTVRELW